MVAFSMAEADGQPAGGQQLFEELSAGGIVICYRETPLYRTLRR